MKRKPKLCLRSSIIITIITIVVIGLIAELVGHCTIIAEVRVRVPFKSEFSALSRFYYLRSAKNCDDHTLKKPFQPAVQIRVFPLFALYIDIIINIIFLIYHSSWSRSTSSRVPSRDLI